MSERVKSRNRRWWIAIPVFVLVVYPLSAIPFALISDRWVSSGIVSRDSVERVIGGIYRPVLRFPPILDDLNGVIKRLMPGRRR
jgi:hypothetical protein